MTTAERYRAAISTVTWILVPLAFTLIAIRYYARDGIIARDFYAAYLPAAERLLDGDSPFDTSPAALFSGRSFPYSALDVLLFAPWALISTDVARWGFMLLNLAAPLVTLRLLKVRDVRVYGIVFLWSAVVTGWQTGNVTLLLGLGVATLWHHRDHPLIAGAVVALLVTVKLMVWPLGVWLLLTRRWRAAAWMVAIGITLNAASWAIVGFDEIDAYRTVVDEVARFEELSAYSIQALVLHLNGDRGLAYALGLLAATVAVAAAAIVWRDGREEAAFGLVIVAGLLGTPVVWPHYYALMITPLAVAWPRLAPAWFVPLFLWLCPAREPRLGEILVALGVLFALGWLIWRERQCRARSALPNVQSQSA